MPSKALRHIARAMFLGLLLGLVINEITFFFLGESSRGPQVVELVIPPGTSEMIKRGEQPPSLPAAMSFVLGDVLLIRNEDHVDHQLGPLWIPAQREARLSLTTTGAFSSNCSFQPNSTLNMEVREPLTLWMRLQGVLMSGIPLGILFALYAPVLQLLRKA